MSILGFDVGGTKISCCLGEADGTIRNRIERSTGTRIDSDRMTKALIGLGSEVLDVSDVDTPEAIGIIFAGLIDQGRGMVLKSPNIPGIHDFPVSSIISDFFQTGVYLENDATAAAIAERLYGSGRGVDNFVYLTLSTGIGGGVFANGKLLRGQNGMGGEIGHMVVTDSPVVCGCGRKGCLEAVSSGSGILKRTLERLKKFDGNTTLRNYSRGDLDARIIFEQAHLGDLLSSQIMEDTVRYLSIGLANVAMIFDPEIIVLGGGLMNNGDWFLRDLRERFEREMSGLRREVELVRALPDGSDKAAISIPVYYGNVQNV
jgi:glucokinase